MTRGSLHDRRKGADKAVAAWNAQATGPAGDRSAPGQNTAQMAGSQEGALVHIFRLRRADGAYRFISRILGRTPELHRDPAVRDREITALREELSAGA